MATTLSSPRRDRRRGASGLVLAGAVAVLGLGAAGGCVPLAVGAGLLGEQGGAERAIDANPYGGPETSVQNGRTDPTIADALRASHGDISEECRAALAALEGSRVGTDDELGARADAATEPAPACRTHPVCLPGAARPVAMRLCVVPGRR